MSSMTGSEEPAKPAASKGEALHSLDPVLLTNALTLEAFRSFEGSGRTLGSEAADPEQRRAARAAAAEAAMRRAGQAGAI